MHNGKVMGLKKGRDEKFGPQKPRNRGDREIGGGGAKLGGLTVFAPATDVIDK